MIEFLVKHPWLRTIFNIVWAMLVVVICFGLYRDISDMVNARILAVPDYRAITKWDKVVTSPGNFHVERIIENEPNHSCHAKITRWLQPADDPNMEIQLEATERPSIVGVKLYKVDVPIPAGLPDGFYLYIARFKFFCGTGVLDWAFGPAHFTIPPLLIEVQSKHTDGEPAHESESRQVRQ